MKKLIILILAVATVAAFLTGCDENIDMNNGEKLKIVVTIFPEYDWVKELIKGNDKVDIKLLLDKGVDLHNFQPSADDIISISSCDMFIYVGGESDEWVEDVLKDKQNRKMKVINLLEVLGSAVKEEEIVEGMQAEEEAHEYEHEEHGDDDEDSEYDEHVWLSLKNAKIICKAITDNLIELDSDNKFLYESNLKAYQDELTKLDSKYQDAVKASSVKTVLFGDRFPFRYLVDDYGLKYYAAFAGCSAESEASFETITFLAKKVDELKLHAILQIESADGKIAETIKANTTQKNQKILTMDSMQSKTSKDVADNVKYLSVMEKNLEVLKDALK